MFAFSITTLAMCLLLPNPRSRVQDQKQCSLALALLTTAGVVFRSELALLVGTQTLFLLATRRINLTHTIIAGLIGLTTGLNPDSHLDSTFWQTSPLAGIRSLPLQRASRPILRMGHRTLAILFPKLPPPSPLQSPLLPPRHPSRPTTTSNAIPRTGTSNPGAFLRRALQLPAAQGMAFHRLRHPISYGSSRPRRRVSLDASLALTLRPSGNSRSGYLHTRRVLSVDFRASSGLGGKLPRWPGNRRYAYSTLHPP
jgi:hypothetical protein